MPKRTDTSSTKRKPVLIDLALQGGGSHGAFTWSIVCLKNPGCA